jgi:hypothetical protein
VQVTRVGDAAALRRTRAARLFTRALSSAPALAEHRASLGASIQAVSTRRKILAAAMCLRFLGDSVAAEGGAASPARAAALAAATTWLPLLATVV